MKECSSCTYFRCDKRRKYSSYSSYMAELSWCLHSVNNFMAIIEQPIVAIEETKITLFEIEELHFFTFKTQASND